jgi:hypothetical protein
MEVLGCMVFVLALGTLTLRVALWLNLAHVARRCQRLHFAVHKASCKEYSKCFLHCATCDRTCDRTVHIRPCTTCYKVAVCDRASCSSRHSEDAACIPLVMTTEIAVLADVTIDSRGEPYILCSNGETHKGSMQGILSMLILMKRIPILIDRIQLVYIQFGGVITTIPESFSENFECTGERRGVSFSNRIEYRVCADGMERIPVPTIQVAAGAGGPGFATGQAVSSLSAGRNLLKLQIAVVPVEHMSPSRQPVGRG